MEEAEQVPVKLYNAEVGDCCPDTGVVVGETRALLTEDYGDGQIYTWFVGDSSDDTWSREIPIYYIGPCIGLICKEGQPCPEPGSIIVAKCMDIGPVSGYVLWEEVEGDEDRG